MPTLTVAGHSVTVGDEFLKLSPEEQNSTVDEIAKSLPATKPSSEPSGVAAGFEHGVSQALSGPASTIGLTGATTPALDAMAVAADAKNYKSAPIFDTDGFHPSNIPQALAEAAPGLATDMVAGKTGATLGSRVGGVRGGVLGGLGGFLGSALLRNFGPGAHANADARTGVENSPVETKDLTREASKQALEAVPNLFVGGRLVPGASKALVESALAKLGTTAAVGAGAGVANDAINQIGTTAGSKDGVKYDWHGGANAATTGALLNTALASPRAASELSANRKFGGYEATPEDTAAAQAVANRQLAIADGRPLVGPLGGTKVAADASNGAHTDIHSELAAATKDAALSPANTNTLSRINSGEAVAPGEVAALAAEAQPDVMHLARQALISKQEQARGNLTDDKFTGGIGGAMENLAPIKSPVKAVATTGAAALAALAGHAVSLGTMGALAPAVLGGVGATYGAGRLIDRLTGSRAPNQAFTDRFGGTDTPVRTALPQAPIAEPATTSVPQVPVPQDTQLWGAPQPPVPSLRATLNSNAKVDTGITGIVKQIQAAKQKATIADAMPALAQLAQQNKPVPPTPEPAAPNLGISPINRAMLLQKLKQGLPPEPAPPVAQMAPVAAAAPPINPLTLPRDITAPAKNIMAGARNSARAQASAATPSDAPASPAIGSLLHELQSRNALPEVPAENTPPISALPAENAVPPAPVIAKLSKKAGKPVVETPHAEEDQPYTPIPEEGLWRKGLTDAQVADKELSSYGPKVREKYGNNVMDNRANKRDALEQVAQDHPADSAAVEGLYHQLDTHSRRTNARRAIKHYTQHMSAAASKAVHDHFTHAAMKEMWRNE